MKRPNFFVIGAYKSATTSLCDLIAQHPDVFFSVPKEPQFFSYPHKYKLGYEWYESLFAKADGFKAVGEGSTSYSMTGTYPHTPRRIHEYAPDARIIYIVREPLARLESAFIHSRSLGWKMPAEFGAALRERPEFIDSAKYWSQVQAYKQFFPDSRILVLFFEDFSSDEAGVTRRCFEFLGLNPDARLRDPATARNVWQGKREDGAILHTLRHVPLYDRIRDAIPFALRRRVKKLFTREIVARPQWDSVTLSWVRAEISADIAQFLRYTGRPADYWTLQPAPAGTFVSG